MITIAKLAPRRCIGRVKLGADVDEDREEVAGEAKGVGASQNALQQSAAGPSFHENAEGHLAVDEMEENCVEISG
jgi:hypothetical protein